MLTMILIDVQYLHNVCFSFEERSNGQNLSLSDSQHEKLKNLTKKIPYPPLLGNCPTPLYLVNTICETLIMGGLYRSSKLQSSISIIIL